MLSEVTVQVAVLITSSRVNLMRQRHRNRTSLLREAGADVGECEVLPTGLHDWGALANIPGAQAISLAPLSDAATAALFEKLLCTRSVRRGD